MHTEFLFGRFKGMDRLKDLDRRDTDTKEIGYLGVGRIYLSVDRIL